jgi:hypothetical protein
MRNATKAYIGSVIAAGGLILAVSLANGPWLDPRGWAIYLVLAVLASVVKLRLPGLDGKPRTSALSLAGDSTIAVSNIVGIPITTASASPILPSSRSNPGSRNVIAIIAELSRTVP